MFSVLQDAPEDPILGLAEAFGRDENPEKINLGVGVYKDADGKTPIQASVRAAEQRLLEKQTTKSYLPMQGDPEYGRIVRELLFGTDHAVLQASRAYTAHTPGGTGALRVVGDFLHKAYPTARLWLPTPTWANHPSIFKAAGIETASYAYFDAGLNGIDIDAMLASLKTIPSGDVVLVHGCCQNPTGADPTPDQWRAIAEIIAEQGVIPIVDIAYQGFAEGVEEDAVAVRVLGETVPELFVCSSFSKNFGLYNERVGALTVVGASAEEGKRAMGHIKLSIRTNYSNPPAHGAAIVSTIMQDAELTSQWLSELAGMRSRISGMRSLFVDTLRDIGVTQDFGFLTQQRGMFSFSGLTPEQVKALRDNYSIYIVGSGRINVAGMTESNMGPLCQAIKAVI